MKKILIIGSSGMLGRTAYTYFRQNGYQAVECTRDVINLANCNYDELYKHIKFRKPDIVFNCAGLIVQRKDTSTEDFLHVNSIIPRWLANICEELDIQMYHPTTDCIYNGLSGPYEEGIEFSESGIYGISKALGEPGNCAVIRTSIIGEEKRNKLSFLEWVRSNKGNTVNGYTNHLWNGVTCLEMCKIIDEIITSDTYYKGTKHYYAPTVTKADMVEYVNDVYELGITVNSIDKSLASKYTECRKDLRVQIQEQKDFWL